MSAAKIHAQAIISPEAKIGAGVEVSAFAVVGASVELGEGCVLHPHAVVSGPSKFGARNVFHSFCVIGGDPQDYTFGGERVELEAGDGNIYREYVTISRGTIKGGGITRIGNNNFFLAYAHVGHDCEIGSHTLFVNGATLAGHVSVEDFVTVGALCIYRGEHRDYPGCAAVFAGRDRAENQVLWAEHDRAGAQGIFRGADQDAAESVPGAGALEEEHDAGARSDAERASR